MLTVTSAFFSKVATKSNSTPGCECSACVHAKVEDKASARGLVWVQ